VADAERGRQIFEQRVEYPLPKKAGVRDYVFYLAENKGFGAGARTFFGKHYANHVKKEAATLQDVFTTLSADITAGGITQIGELVLVAHGNAAQLFFPVMKDGPGIDPVYRCVTEYSISKLWDEIDAGKFKPFSDARKAVAAHMLDDSWVTIRACNIGKSAKTLYALYAMFGGRANVYAPTQYLFFGDCYVGPGERVPTKFDVYDYLVKQHFLAANEHAPNRQAAIVTDLLDPESYSMPFELASAQLTASNVDEVNAYQALVDQLSAYRLAPALRQKFEAAQFPLSPGASVVRSVRYTNVAAGNGEPATRSTWFVLDKTVQSDGSSFDLVYEIHDQLSGGDGPQTETLEARARIASLMSSNASFPFQLFFDQDTDDEFKGIVARLAGYADGGADADADFKDEFTATEALLDAGNWSGGSIDLAQRINARLAAAGLDVLADPPPPIQPPPAGAARVWKVGGPQALVIALEVTRTPDGFPAYSLTALRDLTPEARLQAEHDVFTHKGRVPDTPGIELAAYLDRFSNDDLDGLLAFLRANYRPAYAFYVNHAQEAMQRKRDFLTWYAAHVDQNTTVLDDYTLLRPGENDDLKNVAFVFDFNKNWAEVKGSSRYVIPFQTDLFDEDELETRLKIEGTWICGQLEPDSPSSSKADARASEVPGHEKYFQLTPGKTLFEPPHAPVSDGCADFRRALEKWKELRDSDATPELEKQTLEELTGEDGESYYKKVQEALEPFHLGTELWDMAFDTKIEWRVFATEKLATWVTTEWLKEAFAAASETLEIAAPITIGFHLWMHFNEVQEEAVERWNLIGQIVAIRQWCLELINLANKAPFPDQFHIDLGGADAAIDRWIAEQQAEHAMFNILTVPQFPDDLKAGFVLAADSFGRIGPQIVEQADKYVSEKIAELGLDPCRIKVLTDIGLLDLDGFRRSVIKTFATAVRDSLPPL
jgi:hypothetical protein